MNSKIKNTLIHLIGILTFLSLPVFFSPDFLKKTDLLKIIPFQMDMLFHVFLLLLFYVNYYWLSTKFLIKGQYLRYFLIIVALFIATQLLSDYLQSNAFKSFKPKMMVNPPQGPDKHLFRARRHFNMELAKHLFQFGVVIALGSLFRIDARRRQIESEKKALELSFLKSQIQPHFLFNTLNSIYALALEKSEYTAKAVVKLSDMMRYVINDAGKDFVPLTHEIAYIRNYIDLQALRITEKVNLETDIKGDFASEEISPMILVTFIENAFKYGVNPDKESLIVIRIHCNDSELELFVYNDKTGADNVQEVMQIGVKNTMERLDHVYPGRYNLRMTENENNYTLTLKIRLK